MFIGRSKVDVEVSLMYAALCDNEKDNEKETENTKKIGQTGTHRQSHRRD